MNWPRFGTCISRFLDTRRSPEPLRKVFTVRVLTLASLVLATLAEVRSRLERGSPYVFGCTLAVRIQHQGFRSIPFSLAS